jgi:hypothetical protein
MVRKSITDKLDHIAKLRKEQDILYKKLRESVTIETLVPGVFDHGKASVVWVAKPDKSLDGYSLHGTLTDGNGVKHMLPDNAAEILGVKVGDLTPKK